MDTSQLTDYQLYEIIQDKKLHNHIRIVANKEFNKRNLSINDLREIVLRHESLYNKVEEKALPWQYRILLIICPFILPLHTIIASRFLTGNANRKWKAYWLYICFGFVVWTIALLAFSRFIFSSKNL